MTIEAPIIFIHYNDSPYLKYTLRAAKIFNPEKRVILIGDSSNEKYTKYGIEHFYFDEYTKSPGLEAFHKVYKRIGGVEFEKMNKSKGGTDWTKFNFMKWFVLHNFLKAQPFQNFWSFDSDTLLVEDLKPLEKEFQLYDYTVMNIYNQLQGYVTNSQVLVQFQRYCLGLLSDEAYLNKLRTTDFTENPGYGFTMMRVFRAVFESEVFKTKRINTFIQNSYFDECICEADGKETVQMTGGEKRLIKKTYVDNLGNLYHLDLPTNQYIKLNAINLSWVPSYYFSLFFNYAKVKLERQGRKHDSSLKAVSLDVPLGYQIRKGVSKIKGFLSF